MEIFFKFYADFKEDFEAAEFEKSYIVQRIQELKNSQCCNYELQLEKFQTKLNENEITIKRLSWILIL